MGPAARLSLLLLLLLPGAGVARAQQQAITRRRISVRWSDPAGRISFAGKPITLTEAAEALGALGPYRVRYMGPVRRIAPRIAPTGFWDALLRICALSGLEQVHWAGRRLSLGPGLFRLVSHARVGPYLVVLTAPSKVADGIWQLQVTLDRLQFSEEPLSVTLRHGPWQLVTQAGRVLPLRLVREERTHWRRRLVFQVALGPADRGVSGQIRSALSVRFPLEIRSGTVPLAGGHTLRDDALGVRWVVRRQQAVWGGTQVDLAATGKAVALHRVALVAADGKVVEPSLSWEVGGLWRFRFPPLQGRPVGVRVAYYGAHADRTFSLTLPGIRLAAGPAPARRLRGAIQILSPPAGAARITVGFRALDHPHSGVIHAALDLGALARSKAIYREDQLEGHLRWRGTEVRYALDRLRPGRYQVWVRYRRNLMAVGRLTMPALGTLTRDWSLDCRQVVDLSATVDRSRLTVKQKIEPLRVFLLPLRSDGTPALDNYRDGIHGRIETDGSVTIPFLGLGRYRVLALNDVSPDRPYRILAQYQVTPQSRPTWVLREP